MQIYFLSASCIEVDLLRVPWSTKINKWNHKFGTYKFPVPVPLYTTFFRSLRNVPYKLIITFANYRRLNFVYFCSNIITLVPLPFILILPNLHFNNIFCAINDSINSQRQSFKHEANSNWTWTKHFHPMWQYTKRLRFKWGPTHMFEFYFASIYCTD